MDRLVLECFFGFCDNGEGLRRSEPEDDHFYLWPSREFVKFYVRVPTLPLLEII
jgi:hypothetical protein